VERQPDPSPDAFEQFSELQVAQLLAHLSGALTERQQSVIVLRYRDEQTFEEIALRLGIAHQAAQRLHERATLALRERLAEMRIFRVRDVI
jgi:DNA-directed RNA polymerase specialized sigma subunit